MKFNYLTIILSAFLLASCGQNTNTERQKPAKDGLSAETNYTIDTLEIPKEFRVVSEKSILFDYPDTQYRRNEFLAKGDFLQVLAISNGFGYATHPVSGDSSLSGWVLLNTLDPIYLTAPKSTEIDSTSSFKREEMPPYIVNAKDTFYSTDAKYIGGEPQYYEDIQFLKGKYRLNSIRYPCVEIRNAANRKQVIYHFTNSSSNTFIYKKVKDYWVAKYFFPGDTSRYWFIYQYVLPDQEVAFMYSNKEASWFSDVSIVTENRKTIYMPKKGLSISPDLQNIPIIKRDYEYLHETILIEGTGLVKVQTLRTMKNGVVAFDLQKCYLNSSKSYSLEWWTWFGRSLHKEKVCNPVTTGASRVVAAMLAGE